MKYEAVAAVSQREYMQAVAGGGVAYVGGCSQGHSMLHSGPLLW